MNNPEHCRPGSKCRNPNLPPPELENDEELDGEGILSDLFRPGLKKVNRFVGKQILRGISYPYRQKYGKGVMSDDPPYSSQSSTLKRKAELLRSVNQ
jgi:hypothetical protein